MTDTKTYTISINEMQRELIADALAILSPVGRDAEEERALMQAMFEHLPVAEAADPGIVHGFNFF